MPASEHPRMSDRTPRWSLAALALCLGLCGCAAPRPSTELPAEATDDDPQDRGTDAASAQAMRKLALQPSAKSPRESRAQSRERASSTQARATTGSDPDKLTLSRLPLATLIAQGDRLYGQGQCKEALRYLEAAATQDGGQQVRVLNEIYLCQMQLDRQQAAETTFGRIVALGLASGSLTVKLLFQPGSTGYLAEPRISGTYRMWLRQIARETQAAKACLTVTGHSSPSERERLVPQLALQRALSVQGQLESLAPALRGRLDASGMDQRANLLPLATDDLRDALNRRVEFRQRPCREPGGA